MESLIIGIAICISIQLHVLRPISCPPITFLLFDIHYHLYIGDIGIVLLLILFTISFTLVY